MKKILSCWIVLLMVSASAISSMKIDRVILSSNENPLYLDFWPLVAKAWSKMGVKPTLALIADKSVKVDETLGDVIRFEPMDGVPTGFNAQCIRLLLPAYFENEICIIGDIDLIPLSKKFILGSVEKFSDDKFVLYYDKAYAHYCLGRYLGLIANLFYLAAKGSSFKEIFNVSSIDDVSTIIKNWYLESLEPVSEELRNKILQAKEASEEDKLHWISELPRVLVFFADEIRLTKYLRNWSDYQNRCIKLGCGFDKMIHRDRPWTYNKSLFKIGYYTDAHLPRPLHHPENKNKINQLLIDAGLEDLIVS